MTISHRLIALTAAGALALASIVAVALHGAREVRARLDVPTNRGAPLERALLELDAGQERARAERLDLGHADDEIEAARASLHEVRGQLAPLEAGVRELVAAGDRAADEAREEVRRAAGRSDAARRRAWERYALLADMTALVHATDALDSTFRLDPLRARFAATLEALETIERGATRDDREPPSGPAADAIPGAAPDADRSHAPLTDATNGLLALRRSVFDGRSGAGIRYRKARDDVLDTLDGGRRTLRSRLDGPALDTVPARRVAAPAAASHAGAAELVETARRLASGIEALDAAQASLEKALTGERAVDASLSALEALAAHRREIVGQALTDVTRITAETSASVGQTLDTATRRLLVLSAAAALATLAVALLTIRSVRHRLQEVLGIAEALSSGRLDPIAAGGGRDELSPVIDALGRTLAALGGSSRRIRTVSARVRADAALLGRDAAPPDPSPHRTDRTDEPAGLTARIGDLVREGARAAERADEHSRTTSEIAAHGQRTIDDAVRSMQSIEVGAREIDSIGVALDAIAFQTDILALNAAVEASRAGESGRGFAVVAAEVGTLARKSKESVLQIHEIVGRNVRHVDAGTALVHQAGRHMEDLVAGADVVTGLIGEVSTSGRRQIEEIARIDGSVGELERRLRQRVAAAARATETAHDLLEQARILDESVGAFARPEPATPAPPRRRA